MNIIHSATVIIVDIDKMATKAGLSGSSEMKEQNTCKKYF